LSNLLKSIEVHGFHFVVQWTYCMTKCLENGKNCNDFTSNERLEYFESFQKLQKKNFYAFDRFITKTSAREMP
jgi:hypothetical protein